MAIESSQVYLSIICGIYLIVSFIINFTFLVTLLKLRRLNNGDKSNGFLTHLILADFISALFILIPSGFGVYNGNFLDTRACHLQVFFVSFYLSLTFYGMLVLSIERYYKFKYPLSHINFFTRRTLSDKLSSHKQSKKVFWKVLLIIFVLWLMNIFIGLIPLFNNMNDLQYFTIQSQCDYRYEDMKWWLWFYFFFSLTVPFCLSMLFYTLTFRLIYENAQIIAKRQNAANPSKRPTKLTPGSFICDLIIPRRTRKKHAAEKYVDRKLNAKNRITPKVSDTTKLPENLPYYAHLINIETLDDTHENMYNDFHVRKQLLVQFKYDTERSKATTFFIITLLSYCLVFPLFVIHFYRTYNFDGTTYDNSNVVSLGTYSTFVWLSYMTLVLKSLVCLVHNKFYRYSLYQSVYFRGFHGDYDYEVQRFNRELKQFKNVFSNSNESKRESKKLKIRLNEDSNEEA